MEKIHSINKTATIPAELSLVFWLLLKGVDEDRWLKCDYET
jgi:hypothetical protein